MKMVVEQVLSYSSIQPNKIAISDGKKCMTFKELAREICKASEILSKEFKLGKGDSVIISADKQIEFVSVYFACHILGVISLPIAPDINEERYQYIKKEVQPKLIIGFNDLDSQMVSLDYFVNSKVYSGNEEKSEDIGICLDDIADIMFTTGTTGQPKGVKLTQRNIAAAARNINIFVQNKIDDVEMIALPISHSFGIGRLRCALANGQTVVILGSFANVKRFYRFIDEYRINGFGMVPSSWALLKRLSGDNICKYADQLHYIEIGSAPMDIEDKRYLMTLLPDTRICMHYGLTEASRSAFIEFHNESDKLETVGKQSPNMYITIRNESGEELKDGEEGEICVSGDAVTVGYLDQAKEVAFWGDVFRTGDWGIKNIDGYISLKSRKKELINVGGKKVSPIEVEEVLKTLDIIDDCVCVGSEDPDGILGEVVKAFVVTTCPDKISKDYINGLIGKRLEGYKLPVIYELIKEIPKTSSGKIQRLSLK